MMRLEVRTLPPRKEETADLRMRTKTAMKDLRKRRRWTRELATTGVRCGSHSPTTVMIRPIPSDRMAASTL